MPLRWPGHGSGSAASLLNASRRANPDGQMPLIEHIRELRSRLLKALIGLGLGMAIGWIFFTPIWKFLEHPFCKAVIHGRSGCHGIGDQLVVTGIFDPFMLHLKVAFIVGLVLSSPVWLYQLWAFIAPGLYSREKRYTYAFVGTSVPLFAAGGAFAYMAMSRGLNFLLGLTPHGVGALPSVDTYLGYAMAMLLIFGLAFELPLALVILNFGGILTHERFRKWRRMMIFGVFAFAAVATPSPDPFTMLLLAVPCVVLVEFAEVAVWANDRRRARRPSTYAGLSDDEASPLDMDGVPGADEPAGADRG
ncbi:MAG: twin-arginine translocase subunit TatC [Micromonosporaceae bacterium]